MLKKCGSYFADWDDAEGRRKREAFPTKKQAVRYQAKMRALTAAAKKALAPRPRARSAGLGWPPRQITARA